MKTCLISVLLIWGIGLNQMHGQQAVFTEELSNVESMLPQTVPDGNEWKLIFNDEFNDAEINRKKWQFYGEEEPMVRRDGFWTSEAIRLDTIQNVLVMTTYKEDGQYYDGCLHTDGLFETTFGYFESRVQLHRQEGHWPAFWLWTGAVDRVGKGGTDGAEIDIFEKFKTNRKVQHTIHWDGYLEDHEALGKKSRHKRIMKGFHTFGMWWSPDFYRFYVDGKLVWETDAGGVCQVPLHILISDEVGRHKRMRSISRAKLPDEWLVDYVRVWKLD